MAKSKLNVYSVVCRIMSEQVTETHQSRLHGTRANDKIVQTTHDVKLFNKFRVTRIKFNEVNIHNRLAA
jgi:hypothetical protein